MTLIIAKSFRSDFEFLFDFFITETPVEHTAIVAIHIVVKGSQIGAEAFQIAAIPQARNIGYFLNIKTHAQIISEACFEKYDQAE